MPPSISRRRLIQTGLAAAAVGTLGLPLTAPAAVAGPQGVVTTAADEFDTLRLRWVELCTGGEVDAADPAYRTGLERLRIEAEQLVATLDVSPGRTALWPDLPLSPQSGNFSLSLTRLRTIALARATPAIGLADPATALTGALDFLNARAYNETLPETGNWWFWEIGAPKALLDTCLLAYDALSADQVERYVRAIDRFVPDPNRRTNNPGVRETGANRVDKALIVARRGILGRSAAKLVAARDALSDVAENGRNSVFAYVTGGDGFYRDGSFVQHSNLAYVGTYGTVALGGVANLVALLGGSSWQVDDPNRSVFLDAVEASFAPFMSDGLMMDAVSGRAISRELDGDHRRGHAVTSAVLLLATGAEAAYAGRFRALAKGWIERDGLDDYLAGASIPEISRAQAVLQDRAIRPAPQPPAHFQFPNQDRVVHRRDGWSVAFALSSRRMARYEWGNGENLRGWYVGDGMTYLYTAEDQRQYDDEFWPTVDAQRMPGTTVSTRPRQPHAGTAGTGTVAAYADWVGGASYRDRAGAVGLHLINHDRSVQARKSWFCLSDRIVALGAGISGTDGHPVETVVENRNLHAEGSPRLVLGGVPQPSGLGWSRTVDRPRWAHLEGVGGYVFPAGGRLRVSRTERTGSWQEINTGNDTAGSATPYTRRYLTAVLDHGTDPDDAGYAYILVPRASVWRTALLAVEPGVRILANTATVQAVHAVWEGLVLANFWAAGEAGELTASGPASVVLGTEPTQVHLAVSDPSRTVGTLRLTVGRRLGRVLAADAAMTVLERGARTVLDVAVGDTRGATHTVTFGRW